MNIKLDFGNIKFVILNVLAGAFLVSGLHTLWGLVKPQAQQTSVSQIHPNQFAASRTYAQNLFSKKYHDQFKIDRQNFYKAINALIDFHSSVSTPPAQGMNPVIVKLGILKKMNSALGLLNYNDITISTE